MLYAGPSPPNFLTFIHSTVECTWLDCTQILYSKWIIDLILGVYQSLTSLASSNFLISMEVMGEVWMNLKCTQEPAVKANWSVSNEKMYGTWNGQLTIQIFLLWWRKPECTFLDIWNPRSLSSVLDTSVFSRIWRSSKFHRLSIDCIYCFLNEVYDY